MIKRLLVGGGMLAASGLLVSSTGLYGSRPAPSSPHAPVIALVNEDQPASFNDRSYVFGRDFVSLVAGDNRYQWEVVSRGVAEKAFADKAVDAVIVLPRSFSRDILTLQDLNPRKAVIDYKVVGGDELSQQQLQNEVFTILREFNARVVQMYFASVAGNISAAQVNVGSIVGGQSRLVEALASSLQPSVEEVSEGQKSSISLSEILRAMNSAWIAAQNSFTTSATETLTATSSSLAAQQPGLADYFTLQEQIARINIANGNGAIATQSLSDKSFYDRAFADHVSAVLDGDSTWSGLAGLSSTNADGDPAGALPTLSDTIAGYNRLADDYNAHVRAAIASLDEQRVALEGSLQALGDLEKRLLHEYFEVSMPADNSAVGLPGGDTRITDANYDVDLTRLTAAMARAALAQKLAQTFAADGTAPGAVQKYEDRVRHLLGTVSTDAAQYEPVFEAMEAADPAFDRAPYLKQLRVIRQYDKTHGIIAPRLTVFRPGAVATPQKATATVPVKAGPGERLVVDAVVQTQPSGPVVAVSVGAPPACAPATPDCLTLDQAANTVTIDNTAGTEAIALAVEYSIDLSAVTGAATVSYTARDAASPAEAPRDLGSDTYLLAPPSTRPSLVGSDLSSITEYLGSIRTAASLLQFLYGSPDDTADSFHDAVLSGADFAGRSGESVYNRYALVGAATIRDALSGDDVRSYQELGHDNIAAVVAQISAVRKHLDSVVANTNALSGLHLSDSHFSDALQQLENWYAAAMTSVNAAPERWNESSNEIIQLATVPWNGQKDGNAELYLDDRTGPDLYQSLSHLLQMTSRGAQTVASGAQLITDNSAQFDALMAGVQRTQAETRAVLNAMEGTATTGGADLAAGSAFSERFATVLSNTRASGIDPASIYDHFANPVTVEDRTPAAGAAGGAPFNYRWAAIFAAGALIGAALILVGQLAVRKRNARAVR